MDDNLENIDFLIHDMGNILFSISGMIVTGQYEKAQEKLKEIFGIFQNIKINFSTMDYLMNAKIKIMDKYKIKYNFDKNIMFPDIDESYLCIIFGNIIDNSIESCVNSNKNVKYIRFKFIKIENKYIYEILNTRSLSKEIVKRKHLGLKIIKKLINKIGGTLKIFKEQKIFRIKIILLDKNVK